MRNQSANTDYVKSNAVETVCLSRFKKGLLDKVINAKGVYARAKQSQALIDYLSEKFGIQSVRVYVTEKGRPQYKSGNGKVQIHGVYRYHTISKKPVSITMYNTTSCTGVEVSGKTFATTLIHEFIHHYDINVLGLYKSPHTGGFYKRITDLMNKLK